MGSLQHGSQQVLPIGVILGGTVKE